jgi:hypothetical protein
VDMSTHLARRRKLLDLQGRFRAVLLNAASQRDKRLAAILTEYGSEREWERFERETMLAAVNEERARRNLSPATADQIQGADSQASGHIDYVDKFALYCAEIAMGIERSTY